MSVFGRSYSMCSNFKRNLLSLSRHAKSWKAQAFHKTSMRKTHKPSTLWPTSICALPYATSANSSSPTPRRLSSWSWGWSVARLKPSWPYVGAWPLTWNWSAVRNLPSMRAVFPPSFKATLIWLLKSYESLKNASGSCTASPASRVLSSLKNWGRNWVAVAPEIARSAYILLLP